MWASIDDPPRSVARHAPLARGAPRHRMDRLRRRPAAARVAGAAPSHRWRRLARTAGPLRARRRRLCRAQAGARLGHRRRHGRHAARLVSQRGLGPLRRRGRLLPGDGGRGPRALLSRARAGARADRRRADRAAHRGATGYTLSRRSSIRGFLFNTLNGVTALMHRDPVTADPHADAARRPPARGARSSRAATRGCPCATSCWRCSTATSTSRGCASAIACASSSTMREAALDLMVPRFMLQPLAEERAAARNPALLRQRQRSRPRAQSTARRSRSTWRTMGK